MIDVAVDGGEGCNGSRRRPVPTSVFTNIAANRTMTEMLALANEMAQRIAYDTREWTMLKKTRCSLATHQDRV